MQKSTSPALILVYLLAVCLGSLLQSCASGETLVQEHKKFRDVSTVKKIISIEPDFLLIDQRKEIEDYVLKTEAQEESYQQSLIDNAALNDIEVKVYAPNTIKDGDVDYYNSLLPLKKQILFAMSTQDVDVYQHKNRGSKFKANVAKQYFDNSMEFDTEFGHLAKKYGTPYFSLNGVISFKKKKIIKWIYLVLFPPIGINSFLRNTSETLYYHVVVDVTRGEVVHRELRSFDDPLTKYTLQSLLYDSYNVLKFSH